MNKLKGNPNLEAEERLPIWYIMDEFGSRIQHSDDPTVRLVPFFYMNEQASYSVMFPITDLDENDEITRDFIEGSGTDVVSRSALLLPWSEEFSEKYLDYISLEQAEPTLDYFSVIRQSQLLKQRSLEKYIFLYSGQPDV